MSSAWSPTWQEVLASAVVVAVPLRVPFRGLMEREAVIITGPHGAGEFAPFDDYAPDAASWWLDSALESAYLPPPASVRTQVPVNAIIPGVDPVLAGQLAASAADYRTVKIKVGSAEVGDDVARVAAVRSRFPGAVRVDANGAWSVAEAVTALRALDQAAGGLEYAEQPCATLLELAELRRLVDVPIAADESIRRAEDPVAAARAAAADVLVVKAPPLGGVRRSLEVIAAAQVPVVVSSALDTGVGLATGIRLAAAVPALAGDCGLGTGELLADDIVVNSPVPSAGFLPADYTPQIDPEALRRAQARVSEARRRWWLRRLEQAWNSGTARRLPQLLADSAL